MKFEILGQGAALPPYSIGKDESAGFVIEYFCRTDRERKLVPFLYKMAGVERRYSVLLKSPEGNGVAQRYPMLYKPKHPDDKGPGIRERMAEYERESAPLAVAASREALDRSGLPPEQITHLITVSCSGFAAPGVDIRIIKELGLKPTVHRTHIGFMGCHGALNGLRVAQSFAQSNERTNLLLCAVELCSIHYHYGWDPDHIVANALFADGAAAIVGAARNGTGGWQITATGACLVPDSEDAMTWGIGDHGFIMSLSAHVPNHIETHLRPWLESWLAEQAMTLPDIKTWAVHPGGPRILTSVEKALGLPKDALAVSRDTLRNYGNMSSPTILFILKRLRELHAPRPCVALGFGPGLMVEAVLFGA